MTGATKTDADPSAEDKKKKELSDFVMFNMSKESPEIFLASKNLKVEDYQQIYLSIDSKEGTIGVEPYISSVVNARHALAEKAKSMGCEFVASIGCEAYLPLLYYVVNNQVEKMSGSCWYSGTGLKKYNNRL